MTGLVGLASPAPAASLRPSVVVEGDVVHLGDIFEDAGEKADTAVLYSPAPGRSVTLTVNWLAQVARLYQVGWRPVSIYDRVVVERAGKLVSASDVMGPLHSALVARGMPEHNDVELFNRSFEISLPLNVPATVEVRNLTYDGSAGTFNALVLAGGEAAGAVRALVQGRTYATVPIAVARRTLNAGQIIRKDDLETAYRREALLTRDIVTDPAQLIGKTPIFRLRAGEPIREPDTKAPLLVTQNGHVVIKLEYGPMTLTTQGKALENGARGDVIRVENLQSNKIIEATVVGPDLVTVSLGPRVATN